MTGAKERSDHGRVGARLPQQLQQPLLPIQLWKSLLAVVVLLVTTNGAVVVVVGQELFPLCEVCGCSTCPPGFRVTKGEAVYPIPVELQELTNGNTEGPCSLIEEAGLMQFIPPEVCSDEYRLDDDFRRICGCPPVPTTTPKTPASVPVPIPSKPVSRPVTTAMPVRVPVNHVIDDDDDDDDDATPGKAFRPSRHDNKKHKRTSSSSKGGRGKGVAKPKEKSPQPPAAAPAMTPSSVSKCKQVTLLLDNVDAFITRLNQRIDDTGLPSVKLVVVSANEVNGGCALQIHFGLHLSTDLREVGGSGIISGSAVGGADYLVCLDDMRVDDVEIFGGVVKRKKFRKTIAQVITGALEQIEYCIK